MVVSIPRRVISQMAANKAVQTALAFADENGWNVAAIVVDLNGDMIAAGRMDKTPAAVMAFAMDKARTAVLGKPTTEFAKRMLSSAELNLGLVNRPGLCAWDGGLPIREDGELIGAIGVSGAAGPDDVKCATAGLASIGL